MQQNGCDTAALQRFNPNGGEGPTRDAMAQKVRTAAEATGRKFYIMYDVTGWTNMQSEIKTDWTNKMTAHTASPAYARQNGKPVVCIWGFGFNDDNHPFTPPPAWTSSTGSRARAATSSAACRPTGAPAPTTRGPASPTSTTRST